MRTYIYHQSTSTEQTDLPTHSPEIPQPVPSHSRDHYSDKRSRHYQRAYDTHPAIQDYYTWNPTPSRSSRHFTSRNRERDISDSQRRSQTHRERDSSPERRSFANRRTRENTSCVSLRSSPTRDNDNPRPARNSSFDYISPSSPQQTTAHPQGLQSPTTAHSQGLQTTTILPSESGPDTHRRARDPSPENRNLRPHPSTLITSPAPAPPSTVAYSTHIIDLTTGIDQADSPETTDPRQFVVPPPGSFFDLPATIPGDSRFRYSDDPLDRRFHIDWHDLSRLQYTPHSDLETFENFPLHRVHQNQPHIHLEGLPLPLDSAMATE